MPKVTATRVRELLHYDPDTGVFTWRVNRKGGVRAGDVAGSVGNHGYHNIRVDGALYLSHRLAWLYQTGEWPTNKIDHKDRVRTNNAWANLRDVSDSMNAQNQSPRSEFPGAHYHAPSGLWKSTISANKVDHYLGYFRTPEEASAAYLNEKRKLHSAYVG